MANTKSAKKMVLVNERNRIRNKTGKTKVRTFIRKVLESIAQKDVNLTKEAFTKAQSVIMKAKTKGILKFATASRLISRLNSKVKSTNQAA